MARKRTKKVEAEKPVETGLDVFYSEYSDVTQAADPEDAWSRDSTRSSWDVHGIALSDKYPEVTACFPVADGDTVYLLYAIYSTGDSFGHDEDGRISFIEVFKTLEKAETAAKAIREHCDWYTGMHNRWTPMSAKDRKAVQKKYSSEYTVSIVRENGEKMDVHASWNGYFESLSYVEVASFVVGANKRQRY
jgi:hypothetical protein